MSEYDHLGIEATYSPEDNKLRLYAQSRLDKETFQRVKANGFKWAPKQQLFVAPKWTPTREDLCLELAGEISAEQTTLVERAEAKAERLDNLAAKRAAQANSFQAAANSISERFAYGQPILVGHHSERKARKDQERMHNNMDKAVKAARAVDYWQYRADGVEAHANYKASPRVIANRIKTLLKELRDYQRRINHGYIILESWQKLQSITDPELLQKSVESYSQIWFNEGRTCPDNCYQELKSGAMTADEVIVHGLEYAANIINSQYYARWICHILNRLGYERGQLGDVPLYDGELSKTMLQAFARTQGAEKPKAEKVGDLWKLSADVPLPLHVGEGKELLLSEQDFKALMQSIGYDVPADKPRRAPRRTSSVSLINPGKAQAEKLQALWNQDIASQCAGSKYKTPKVAEICETTQAVYSANSGGDYAKFSTIELDENGREISMIWENHQHKKSGEPVCRIRVYTGGYEPYKAKRIVVIVDKPSKPLPVKLAEPGENAA